MKRGLLALMVLWVFMSSNIEPKTEVKQRIKITYQLDCTGCGTNEWIVDSLWSEKGRLKFYQKEKIISLGINNVSLEMISQ